MSQFIKRPVRALAASLAAAAIVTSPALLSAPAHAESGAPASTASLAGVIPFTAADVTRIGGNDWTVSWTAPADLASVQVFVGTSATTFPATATTTDTHATGAITITSATRPWVKLVGSYGAPLVLSARSLGVASDANLRDAGGYRTAAGQWVKEGVLLRSQALNISEADKPALNALGVVSDYDLRTTCEAKAKPDVVPAGASYVHLNVIGDSGADPNNCPTSSLPAGVTSPASAAAMMVQGEVAFVDSDSAKSAYRTLFAGILADQGVSLYHCTAGKDRTGWASAALLTVLGVPADDVMADYLLSNQYYYATEGKATVDQANLYQPGAGTVIAPMMEVRAEYLQAGLDRVKQEFGTMQNYFTQGLGFSVAQLEGLRAKLLVGAPIPGTQSIVKPTITGKAKVGAKLTGHQAVPAGSAVSYQWFADGTKIARATGAKLKVTKALRGKRVSLQVGVTKDGFLPATATSKPVRIKG